MMMQAKTQCACMHNHSVGAARSGEIKVYACIASKLMAMTISTGCIAIRRRGWQLGHRYEGVDMAEAARYPSPRVSWTSSRTLFPAVQLPCKNELRMSDLTWREE